MNLTNLFEIQRKLDAEIEEKHPTAVGEDRLAKRILALQVELGECANEWRGFKFWSNNPFPKPPEHNWRASEDGLNQEWLPEWGYDSYPLLEEYVDCLHFILSIGNHIEMEVDTTEYPFVVDSEVEYQFLSVMQTVSSLGHLLRFGHKKPFDTYNIALMQFINLGKMLNFTEDIIIEAYMSKNKTNWERQANGY